MEVLIFVKAIGLAFRFYRVFLSPAIQVAFGIQCRYEESCSHFTERMIREQGFRRGLGIGIRRILSCNQWSVHG